MSFYSYHGETPAERPSATVFMSMWRSASTSPSPPSDDIADTLDYAHVFELVRAVVEAAVPLIKALAARVAETLLVERRIDSVKVRVGEQPPIAGAIDAAGS